MRTKYYTAKCNRCSSIFKIPTLPDMAYGEFIAKSESGRYYQYLNAFREPAWDNIDKLCCDLIKADEKIDPKKFQEVIGKCMDPVNNEMLSIIDKPKCPNCQSRHMKYISDIGEDFIEINEVSFSNFNRLSKEEIILLLDSLLRSN